jgi:putative ABC transport system permease protein
MSRRPRSSRGVPAPVRFLIRILLPKDQREFYLGDLEESGRRPWLREIAWMLALRLSVPPGRPPRVARCRRSASISHHVLGDLRLGLRRLLKTPAASITVLTALSVGIGLCALMFSVINGVIFPTLPFENGERIVRITRPDFSPVDTETYLYWEQRQRSFEGLGLAAQRNVNLAIEGWATEPGMAASITVSAFDLLSVEPILGRPFTAADTAPGAPAVVLISEDIWRTRFGADPGVLGRIIRLSGAPAEIVGVMAEGFGFPWFQDAWTPQSLDALRPDGNPENFVIFGMLREGISRDTAAAELNALDAVRPRPGTEPFPTPVQVIAYTDLFNPAGVAQLIAGIMLSVALLVLLVACANVTNVLLARAAEQSREVAVRTALGASRVRIATQFWIEVFALALAGAVGGALLALAGVRLIRNAVGTAEGMPFWFDLRVDVPVLVFISIAAMITAIAAGVGPALFASRSNSHELLKDASRATSSRRLGRIMRRLIGAEIAISLVLLVAAGLFVRSAVNLQTYEFSFDPDGVYTALMSPPEDRYASADARAALAEQLEESLGSIPRASSAAVTTAWPGVGGTRRTVAIEGTHLASEPDLPGTWYTATTPGFFPTFRVPLVAGRLFDVRDRAGAVPVALVSESFEHLHLPEGAIGHRIALPEETDEPVWLTIVGVVPDQLAGELNVQSQDAVYVPFAQAAPRQFLIAVRSRTAANALAAPIREAIASVDRDAALSFMRPLDEAIDAANAAYAWFSALFLVAGGLALALAAIGLYGIMAFWVAQRTREIGLRMAIGGGRTRIVGFVLRRGMTPVVLGLAFGLLAALPLAWFLQGALLNVEPFDPLIFGAVLGVLLCAGWLGCLGPALRATRVDPQAALGAE